jgi:hypothetical protein
VGTCEHVWGFDAGAFNSFTCFLRVFFFLPHVILAIGLFRREIDFLSLYLYLRIKSITAVVYSIDITALSHTRRFHGSWRMSKLRAL